MLQLTLSDLTNLDNIRNALTANDPKKQFSSLDMQQLIIADDAIDSLIATVNHHLARAGIVADRGTVVRMVCDDSIILREGQNLKDLVFGQLAENFATERVILTDGHPVLHADENSLDRGALACVGAQCIVSVGGGTITDIAKIAAMRNKTPVHVVVQTAASVDGFTDNFSVVLQNGVKRTLLTRWPDAVLTDCKVLAEAPHELNAAGLGELMSMYIAPGDWFLAAKCGMDNSYTPVLTDLLALCGDGVEIWSEGVGKRDIKGTRRLAAGLAMRGIVTGVGGTSASLSGMEHLISHMLDIYSAEKGEQTGLHGAQVGVGSVLAASAWELFCERLALQPPALADLFADDATWEPRVRLAFIGLDPSGKLGAECWSHYSKKLKAWRDNRAKVEAFFRDWESIMAGRNRLVLKSKAIANCLRRAKAPAHFSELMPKVPNERIHWAVANCQFMRERFTIADLLTFAGWWNDESVNDVLTRAQQACRQ